MFDFWEQSQGSNESQSIYGMFFFSTALRPIFTPDHISPANNHVFFNSLILTQVFTASVSLFELLSSCERFAFLFFFVNACLVFYRFLGPNSFCVLVCRRRTCSRKDTAINNTDKLDWDATSQERGNWLVDMRKLHDEYRVWTQGSERWI